MLDHVILSKTEFDLRAMGIVYGLIFFAGFLMLQRALRYLPLTLSITAQTIWIVVFCNAVYVPMFNTLYFDALSLAILTVHSRLSDWWRSARIPAPAQP